MASGADLFATDGIGVLVLLQALEGGGSFILPCGTPRASSPYAIAGDLNGDRRPDIAVANIGSPSDLRAARSIADYGPIA